MGHEVLSCVFLPNYVPKCQMSSGPYGSILSTSNQPKAVTVVHGTWFLAHLVYQPKSLMQSCFV